MVKSPIWMQKKYKFDFWHLELLESDKNVTELHKIKVLNSILKKVLQEWKLFSDKCKYQGEVHEWYPTFKGWRGAWGYVKNFCIKIS